MEQKQTQAMDDASHDIAALKAGAVGFKLSHDAKKACSRLTALSGAKRRS